MPEDPVGVVDLGDVAEEPLRVDLRQDGATLQVAQAVQEELEGEKYMYEGGNNSTLEVGCFDCSSLLCLPAMTKVIVVPITANWNVTMSIALRLYSRLNWK